MKRFYFCCCFVIILLGIYLSGFSDVFRVYAESDCVWGEWIVDSYTTCTEAGLQHRVCIADPGEPHEEEMIIPALGHDYDITELSPTCTDRGIRTYTCKVCGESYSEKFGALTEHQYEAQTTQESECEKDGEVTYSCVVCGESYTESVSMTGHEYEETVIQQPSCTARGLKEYICRLCGDIYTEEFGNIEQHSLKEITEEEESFVTVTAVCQNCGFSYEIERTEISKDIDFHTANVVAGSANVLLIGVFSVWITPDIKVLMWYNRKKRQIRKYYGI